MKIQRWQKTMLSCQNCYEANLEWEDFELPVYDKNGVHTTDKTKVICKLCNAHFKYNKITFEIW